ncbi:MAG: hypothetical protein WA989_16310 [Henriciella sp.]|uniref:hypothetical protein n=1 Tax=Henriciella sp. TaxID=1968823 RepID=UPI003C732A20
MFIGHYSAAFAARALNPSVPLGLLFVAVQLIDYAFFAFVMVNAGDAAVLPVDFHYMPFSHGVVAVSIWALAAGLLYAGLTEGGGRMMAALVVTAAVVSHVVLDMLVQVPDLPIGYGEPGLGFALAPDILIGQVIEFGLLFAGFALYMRSTVPTRPFGQIAPWLLVGLMIGLQVYNLTTPVAAGQSIIELGVVTLGAFTLLAIVAGIASRSRTSRRSLMEAAPVPVRPAAPEGRITRR